MENERAWLFRLSNRTTSDLCSSGTNEDLEAIATLKLYAAGEGNSLAVGISPSNVVFDGSSILVSNGPSRSRITSYSLVRPVSPLKNTECFCD